MSSLPKRVREHLKELARRRETVLYRDLAKELAVQPPNTIHQVADALEVLMREDQVRQSRLSLASASVERRTGWRKPM